MDNYVGLTTSFVPCSLSALNPSGHATVRVGHLRRHLGFLVTQQESFAYCTENQNPKNIKLNI
jgi:hypothetical protein